MGIKLQDDFCQKKGNGICYCLPGLNTGDMTAVPGDCQVYELDGDT